MHCHYHAPLIKKCQEQIYDKSLPSHIFYQRRTEHLLNRLFLPSVKDEDLKFQVSKQTLMNGKIYVVQEMYSFFLENVLEPDHIFTWENFLNTVSEPSCYITSINYSYDFADRKFLVKVRLHNTDY